MKRNIGFTLLTTLFLVSGVVFHTKVSAQEWSAAQQDVWKVVNNYWAVLAKGDVAGFLEYFHPDYLGWDDNSPLPSTKTDIQKWLQLEMAGSKILAYDIKPVGIRVFGDFAFADYYYSFASEMDGKKKMEEGRWTDILMKQGGKWLIVGDNGGANEKKHED
jgi:ketosteroid isomerase-like protein